MHGVGDDFMERTNGIISRRGASLRRLSCSIVGTVLLSGVLLFGMLVSPGPARAAGGDVVWQAGDARQGKQEALASAVDSAGNVIVTGYQNQNGGTNDDYCTVKFKADGSGVAWRATYDRSGGSDKAVAVAVDGDNNVIVTGYVWNGLNNDIYTVKYDGATGAVLWQHTYDGAAHGNDIATSIVVDGLSNVYVGGYTQNASGDDDFLLLKYGPAGPNPDGTPLWRLTYNGAAGGPDRVNAVAAGAGGVAVTGYSWNGSDFDILTLFYDTTGAKQQEWRFASTAGSGTKDDRGKYVRIDATGNVIVTGYTSNATDKDIYTAKYNAATGALVWAQTYNGGYDDEPTGLAVDAGGDVYVAADTWTLAGHNDFYALRYDGATGTRVWQQTFDSGSGNDDIPTGIVVDPGGDVFVTGYTVAAGSYDFQTLKLKKDNGNLLWQRSYNGPRNLNDRPVGVGLGPAGGVLVAGWSDMTAPLDGGPATATGGTATTLANGGKSWATDTWKNYWVQMTSGQNAGVSRQIQGNSATTLTLSTPFANPVAAGDGYYIYDAGNLDYTVIQYDPGLLNAPTSLSAQTASNSSIQIGWVNNAANADGIKIERCAGLGCTGFVQIATVGGTTASYLDTTLAADSYYTYRVKAYNAANGDSHYSNTAQALTVFVALAPPAWSYTYNGTANSDDFARAIAIGPDNNPVVTGYSNDYAPGYSSGTISFDYLTMKFNRATNSVIWSDRYNDPNDAMDVATCVAVDSSNAVTVSGYATLYNGHSADVNSVFTMKYPAGPPATVTDQYNGPAATGATDDRAAAIASATDGSGNVAVVGYGKNVAGNDDIYLIKYRPDGSRAWAATPFDGGGNDYPSGVAFAPNGDIFVTGYSEKGANANSYNFFSARYSGTTGAIIWTDLYSVTIGGDNRAHGLAVDAAGDLYITGSAANAAGNLDFYTIKYSGQGVIGQRMWERAADGVAHGDDSAAAIGIDPIDGNLVVVGTTHTGTGDNDFRLIRYTPGGDLVWDRTYQRPANDDEAHALAIDFNGNIYVTGTTSNATNTTLGTTTDSLTVKYDYQGILIGATSFNGSANSFDETDAIAVNSLDEVFAAGYTENASGNADYLVYKILPDTTLPSVPYPFAVTSGYTTATLTWADKSVSRDGYTIQRQVGPCAATNTNPWVSLPTQPSTATSYTDTGLNAGSAYCYRIRTFQNASSAASRWNQKPATTLIPPAPGVLAAAAANTTQVNLTWNDTTTGETGFKIERCTGAGCSNFAQIATVTANARSYADTSASLSTTYAYRVLAYGPDWESQYSTTASVTTPAPGVPGSLTAVRGSEAQVNLAWLDAATDESGYRVERSTDGVNFVQVGGDLAANTTSYSDLGLTPDTTYTYRVKAFKNAANPWVTVSNTASATTTNLAPAGLGTTAVNTTRVDLAWTDQSGNETAFAVERCFGSGCTNFTEVATPAANSSGYSDTGVCSATTYSYRVKGVNRGFTGSGTGVWTRRAPLTIANFQPNFITRLTIPYDGAMRTDFGDIRFFDAAAAKELPYFMEAKQDGVSATVWVKTGASNAVYLYYGNPTATGMSSGAGVFGAGLMGFWPFSEAAGTTTGTTADVSGLGNDLTLTGFASPHGIVGGVFGNALSVFPSGNMANRDTATLPTGSVMSAEAWIYPNGYSNSTYNGIVSWGPRYGVASSLLLSIQDSGRPSMATWGNDFVPTSGPAATLNAWNHIAVVLNGTAVTLYMNGQAVSGTLSANIVPAIQSMNLAIGATDYYPGRIFYGMIDNVRIYNRELTTDEIASRYAATLPSVTLGTVENSAGFTFASAYEGPYSTVAVAATPAATPPAGVAALRVSETEIDLSWTDTTSDESGFRVERSPDGVNFTQVGGDLAAGTTGFKDTGLSPNTTYTYRVSAFKTAPCGWVQTSGTVSATTTVVPPSGAGAVASVGTDCRDIRVAASDGTTLLSQWSFPFQCNATATRVWPKVPTIPVGTSTLYLYYGNPAAAFVDNGDATFEFFDDFSGTAIDTTKWTVNDPTGFSVSGGFLHGTNTTGKLTSTKTLAAGNLLAIRAKTTSGANSGQMIGGVFNGYYDNLGLVQRSGDGGYVLNGWGGENYTVGQVPANNMQYNVYAFDATTTTIQVYNWDTGSWYLAPTNIAYNIVGKPISLGLSYASYYWTGQSYATDWDFVLVRKLVNLAPTSVSGGKSYGSYTVGGESFGVRIPITIANSGSTALTDYQAVLPMLDTTPLAADRVSVSWTDTTSSETGFRVERCTGSGCSSTSFTAMDSFVVPANTTSYTDRAVAPATTYCYRVKAILPGGDTAASDPPVCATTSSPTPPANLQATVTGTRIDLTWNDTTTNEDGFQVERCTGSGCDFTTLDDGFPVVLGPNAGTTGSWSDNSGCTGTTYRYRVKSLKPWIAGWPAGYAATLDVVTAFPGAPDAVVASRVSEVQVDLTWANHAPDASGYRVERSTDGVNFVQAGPDQPNTATSFSDTGLVPNTTYTYRIHAFKSGGTCPWDTFSTTTTVTTSVAAPDGLTASAANTTQVDLAWNDHTASETGFVIVRCSGSGCSNFAQVATVGPNVTTYQDTSVASGLGYTYEVRATSTSVPWDSTYSAAASATTPTVGTPVLTATRGSESRVSLSWTDPLTDETGYQVERSSDGTNFVQVGGSLPANSARYSDTTVAAATAYTYRVRGFKTATNGWETVSNTATVTTTINAPTGLSAAAANTTQVNLSWTRTTEGESGFKVERCQGSGCGDFAQIAYITTPTQVVLARYTFNNTLNDASTSGLNLSGSTPTYDDGGLALSTATTYTSPTTSILDNDSHTIEFDLKIRNTNAGWTKIFGYTPAGSDRSPGIWMVPSDTRLHWRYDPGNTGVSALGTNGDGGTPLALGTWYHIRGVKDGATFKLYVNEVLVATTTVANPKTAGPSTLWFGGTDVTIGNFTISQGTWPPPAITYADTTPNSGTVYSYRVRAANTVAPWDSGYSNTATVTTPLPVAPSTLSAVAVTDTEIDLAWTDANADESGVRVERCTGSGCANFVEIQSLAAATRSFNDSGLTPSVTYCYRTRAYKQGANGWYSAYSPTACAETISAHPTNLTATPVNSLKIRLDWTDNASDEDGYEIETQIWSGKWVKTASVGANVHTFTDTVGIEPQKSYNYRVRAYRGTLKSPYSNQAPATTPAFGVNDNTCNYQLTLTTTGPGTVTPSPAGVSCGTNCYAYCTGAQVTLNAFPVTDSVFTGWSGNCAGPLPTCTITVDGDKGVGAAFQ
jgi:uncharacterized delta-60 repeat protein